MHRERLISQQLQRIRSRNEGLVTDWSASGGIISSPFRLFLDEEFELTSTPVFRRAVAADLEAIVAMLADDILGHEREDTSLPLAQSYLDAFAAIEADPNQYLAVVELNGAVVGTLQISYMPGLSHQGAWRGEIESRTHRQLGAWLRIGPFDDSVGGRAMPSASMPHCAADLG